MPKRLLGCFSIVSIIDVKLAVLQNVILIARVVSEGLMKTFVRLIGLHSVIEVSMAHSIRGEAV